jgi:hypothetical protein
VLDQMKILAKDNKLLAIDPLDK